MAIVVSASGAVIKADPQSLAERIVETEQECQNLMALKELKPYADLLRICEESLNQDKYAYITQTNIDLDKYKDHDDAFPLMTSQGEKWVKNPPHISNVDLEEKLKNFEEKLNTLSVNSNAQNIVDQQAKCELQKLSDNDECTKKLNCMKKKFMAENKLSLEGNPIEFSIKYKGKDTKISSPPASDNLCDEPTSEPGENSNSATLTIDNLGKEKTEQKLASVKIEQDKTNIEHPISDSTAPSKNIDSSAVEQTNDIKAAPINVDKNKDAEEKPVSDILSQSKKTDLSNEDDNTQISTPSTSKTGGKDPSSGFLSHSTIHKLANDDGSNEIKDPTKDFLSHSKKIKSSIKEDGTQISNPSSGFLSHSTRNKLANEDDGTEMKNPSTSFLSHTKSSNKDGSSQISNPSSGFLSHSTKPKSSVGQYSHEEDEDSAELDIDTPRAKVRKGVTHKQSESVTNDDNNMWDIVSFITNSFGVGGTNYLESILSMAAPSWKSVIGKDINGKKVFLSNLSDKHINTLTKVASNRLKNKEERAKVNKKDLRAAVEIITKTIIHFSIISTKVTNTKSKKKDGTQPTSDPLMDTIQLSLMNTVAANVVNYFLDKFLPEDEFISELSNNHPSTAANLVGLLASDAKKNNARGNKKRKLTRKSKNSTQTRREVYDFTG